MTDLYCLYFLLLLMKIIRLAQNAQFCHLRFSYVCAFIDSMQNNGQILLWILLLLVFEKVSFSVLTTLWRMVTLAGEATHFVLPLLSISVCSKRKEFLACEANSFLLEWTPFWKGPNVWVRKLQKYLTLPAIQVLQIF